MSTVIGFLLFYAALSLYGRGFSNLFKLSKNRIFGAHPSLFYPIVGLFFLGNLSVLLNFFVQINNNVVTYLLLSLFLLNVKKQNQSIKLNNKLSHYVFIPSIVGISSLGVGLSGDAGLYHLNHQEWLRSNKITFGLVNSHFRFGFSSISEWISANFWINDNLIFLHFLNIIFIVFFFQIIFQYIFSKEKSNYKNIFIALLIVGFLDNFGVNGGKNGFVEIEAIGKSDTPFAILFFLSFLFLYEYSITKTINKNEIFILSLMSLFAFQFRIFGFIALVYFLFIALSKKDFLKVLKISTSHILFLIAWLIKNFITTACIVYPVSFTCLDVSWSATKGASANFAMSDLINVHSPLRSFDLQTWFSEWVLRDINKTVLYNFLLSLIILILYFSLFHKNTETSKFRFNSFGIFILMSLILWMISAPGIRLGIGVILLLYIYLPNLITSKKARFKIQNNKYILSLLFFGTLILVPQTNNYQLFFNSAFSNEFREIKSVEIDYETNLNSFGVIPANNSDKCWINIDCIRNQDEIVKQITNGYVFIKGKN